MVTWILSQVLAYHKRSKTRNKQPERRWMLVLTKSGALPKTRTSSAGHQKTKKRREKENEERKKSEKKKLKPI